MMFGGSAALAGAMDSTGTVMLWWMLILIADWAAALLLFVYLWGAKPATA